MKKKILIILFLTFNFSEWIPLGQLLTFPPTMGIGGRDLAQMNIWAGSCAWALSPGSSGVNFLRLAVGARAAGMGEAFTAVADDASAVGWNPAGLTQIEDKQIFFVHGLLPLFVNQDLVSYAQSWDKYSFGFSANFLSSGKMYRTTENASGDYTGTNGQFESVDSAFMFSFAQRTGGFGFGATLKILRSVIDSYSGNAIGVDVGFLYRFGNNKNFKLAALLQNFGSKMKYSNDVQDGLPMGMRLGGSYAVGTELGKMNLSFDLNLPIDHSAGVHLGLEYWIQDIAAIRIGYKTDRINDLDALSGLCCGGGVKFENFEVDYAYVPYGDLGQTHRISILASF